MSPQLESFGALMASMCDQLTAIVGDDFAPTIILRHKGDNKAHLFLSADDEETVIRAIGELRDDINAEVTAYGLHKDFNA